LHVTWKPDFLLLYKIHENELILQRVGSHDEYLFCSYFRHFSQPKNQRFCKKYKANIVNFAKKERQNEEKVKK
jgi:hypothetical protein